ncbi:MAG: hypothetical protein U0R24_09685 [Solirubrobacterales bacterium]
MQDRSSLSRAGVAALAATGILHLVLAPEYLDEKTYVGALFIAGGVSCLLLAAVIIRRGEAPEWTAAALVAAGMGVGFVLSRTTGLPGYKEGEWEISGLISLLLEATVVVAAVRAVLDRGGVIAQPAR